MTTTTFPPLALAKAEARDHVLLVAAEMDDSLITWAEMIACVSKQFGGSAPAAWRGVGVEPGLAAWIEHRGREIAAERGETFEAVDECNRADAAHLILGWQRNVLLALAAAATVTPELAPSAARGALARDFGEDAGLVERALALALEVASGGAMA